MLAMQWQLAKSERWPADRILEKQFVQLRALVGHAVARVPFYHSHLQRTGIGSVAELTPDIFRRWPILQTSDVQRSRDALLATDYPKAHGAAVETFTTGSTGTPKRIVVSEAAQFVAHAMVLRDHLWHQRQFSAKFAAIRFFGEDSRQPGWSRITNAVFPTGPGVGMDVMMDVAVQLEWLIEERPAYLLTTPSNLQALLARSCELGKSPAGLRQVMTYAESVPPSLRQILRERWGVALADTYSCTEAGTIALQCPRDGHYHVQSESVYVELLDADGRPSAPGEPGRVVITPLHNFAMPLLRYDIGDFAEWGSPCQCGRGLPVLHTLFGRVRNMARDPSGRLFQPGFDEAMDKARVAVRQYQIVQHAPATLEMLYVMDRDLTADESDRLTRALGRGMGYAVHAGFSRVAAIPRSPGGKYEGFISHITDVH